MKQFNRIILAVIASLTLSLAGTAAADHGSSSGSGSGETTATTSQTETHNTATEVVATESGTSDVSGSALRQRGEQEVEQLREQHKPKSTEDRQKVCESHKQGLETKFSHIVTNSQRVQDRISDVLDKAVAYKTDKNLNVANYADLLAKAQTAKATSAAAIVALKAVTPSLDCNNTSVATDVATFKQAAKTTRDDLKSYRTAVKALLQAIRDAKQDTTSEGSNQ